MACFGRCAGGRGCGGSAGRRGRSGDGGGACASSRRAAGCETCGSAAIVVDEKRIVWREGSRLG